MRIPKSYVGVGTTGHETMNENNPANNFYFYMHTYNEYLECREERWKIIMREKE